jgi:thiamine biosynthesis lipoprotein
MSLITDRSSPMIEAGQFRVRFKAMGTNCEILYRAKSEQQADQFRQAAMDWVKNFEQRYTRYKDDSLIGRINLAAGKEAVPINKEDARLFEICDQLHFLTQGLFDPTTLPLSRIWDFKAPNPTVPPEDIVQQALSKVGWQKVIRKNNTVMLPKEGMGLDFGGFGKEYAVDRVTEIALEHDIENILVNFGGDIHAKGSPGDAPCWHVGVEDPNHPGKPNFVIKLFNMATATSGNYMRFFEYKGQRYGHLIDHRTGYPASNNCHSATVVAQTCLEAGILATSCLIEGEHDGIVSVDQFFGAEGCIRTKTNLKWTSQFHQFLVQNENN